MSILDLAASRNSRATELPTSAGLLPSPRSSSEGVSPTSSWIASSVLIIDPDLTTREALRTSLAAAGMTQVADIPSAEAVADFLDAGTVGDLALVSLALGSVASAVISQLRAAGWNRVVALAPTADIGPVIDAVGSGVHGVLIGRRANPAATNVPAAIHELSGREIEVIQLVADGRSNKWIGDQLSLSALTVKSHLARIGRKLGTGDRAHIVALALRAGVVA